MSVHAEIDDGGGEAARIESLAINVTHGSRRHAIGRTEQGNDGAATWIAPDAPPCIEIESEHQDETGDRDRHREVVAQPPACALRRARRLDHALLPGGRHREPALRRQRRGGAEDDAPRLLLDDGSVPALRALRPGVERGLAERHALRQRDARLGLLDGKGPAGAGGVPIELIVVREKSDLPGRAIANDVGVLPARQQSLGAAYAHAHAVRQRLRDEGLRCTIAGDGLDVEPNLDAQAVAGGIPGRKIPQDATADLPPFGFHPDGLGHRKLAVALDRSVADELQDAFQRGSGHACGKEQKECDREPAHHDHGRLCGKATTGAAAELRSSSSKNGSGR